MRSTSTREGEWRDTKKAQEAQTHEKHGGEKFPSCMLKREKLRGEKYEISSSPLRMHAHLMEKGRVGARREGGYDSQGNVDAAEGQSGRRREKRKCVSKISFSSPLRMHVRMLKRVRGEGVGRETKIEEISSILSH